MKLLDLIYENWLYIGYLVEIFVIDPNQRTKFQIIENHP